MLGEGLDGSKVSANYQHGVLAVTVPVAEVAQARRISIDAAQPVEVVEAHEPTQPAEHAQVATDGPEATNGHTADAVHTH
jgi:HSP20 family protein